MSKKIGLHSGIVRYIRPSCANPACRASIELGTIVNELFERITQHLEQGDVVRIHGFGTLSVKFRQGRRSVNIGTGVPMVSRSYQIVTFAAHDTLKNRIDKKHAKVVAKPVPPPAVPPQKDKKARYARAK